MTFAEELKRWRIGMGMTQEQAAVVLLVPVRTLEDWEQDRHEPAQTGPLRKLMQIVKNERRKS